MRSALGLLLLLACDTSKTGAPAPKVDPAAALKHYQDDLRDTGITKFIPRMAARDTEIVITISNDFFSQPKQVRLQLAQSLWRGWAKYRCPGEVDKCYLRIEDVNGNKVAGSDWVGSNVKLEE